MWLRHRLLWANRQILRFVVGSVFWFPYFGSTSGHRGGKQKAKLARTSEKKATRNDDSSDEHDAKAENDSKTLITEVPAMTRISDLFERDVSLATSCLFAAD